MSVVPSTRMGDFLFSCSPFKVTTCPVQKKFLDPCNCTSYYECIVGDLVRRQDCARGTAYKHVDDFDRCVMDKDVYYNGICDPQAPWERCNVTDERMIELQYLCNPPTTTTEDYRFVSTADTTFLAKNTPKAIVTDENTGSMKYYVGYIGGGVFAFLFITLLILVLLVRIRNRNSKRRLRLSKRRLVLNPEYSNSSDPRHVEDEEVYAIIYDRISPRSRSAYPGFVPPLPARNSQKSVSSPESTDISGKIQTIHYGTSSGLNLPLQNDYHYLTNGIRSETSGLSHSDYQHINGAILSHQNVRIPRGYQSPPPDRILSTNYIPTNVTESTVTDNNNVRIVIDKTSQEEFNT